MQVEHTSVDQVVQAVNDQVMAGIRRTVNPLVVFVKDANEKYAVLENVLQSLPIYAQLRDDREELRSRLDKLESNVTLTVQDTATPNVDNTAHLPEPNDIQQMLAFLEQSIAQESDIEAKRALLSVVAYMSKDPVSGMSDEAPLDGVCSFGIDSDAGLSTTAGEVQLSVAAAVDRLLEEDRAQDNEWAEELRDQAKVGSPASEVDSEAASPEPTLLAADSHESPLAAQANDTSGEEESNNTSGEEESNDEDPEADSPLFVSYDAGLVDEFDVPIECYVDDPQGGKLYEIVDGEYEEIGQFSGGVLELYE